MWLSQVSVEAEVGLFWSVTLAQRRRRSFNPTKTVGKQSHPSSPLAESSPKIKDNFAEIHPVKVISTTKIA